MLEYSPRTLRILSRPDNRTNKKRRQDMRTESRIDALIVANNPKGAPVIRQESAWYHSESAVRACLAIMRTLAEGKPERERKVRCTDCKRGQPCFSCSLARAYRKSTVPVSTFLPCGSPGIGGGGRKRYTVGTLSDSITRHAPPKGTDPSTVLTPEQSFARAYYSVVGMLRKGWYTTFSGKVVHFGHSSSRRLKVNHGRTNTVPSGNKVSATIGNESVDMIREGTLSPRSANNRLGDILDILHDGWILYNDPAEQSARVVRSTSKQRKVLAAAEYVTKHVKDADNPLPHQGTIVRYWRANGSPTVRDAQSALAIAVANVRPDTLIGACKRAATRFYYPREERGVENKGNRFDPSSPVYWFTDSYFQSIGEAKSKGIRAVESAIEDGTISGKLADSLSLTFRGHTLANVARIVGMDRSNLSKLLRRTFTEYGITRMDSLG